MVSLYGVYQRLTGAYEDIEMWLDADMFEGIGARIYSTLENPNVLGEYLIIIITLTVAALYYFKKPLQKTAMLAVLGAAGLCMIFTLSRGAWIGLLFAAFIFIMLNDRRLIWLGIIALLISPLILPNSVIERITSIGNIADTSTNYRVNIWLGSVLLLRTFWLSGIGLSTASFVYVYTLFSYNAVYAPHSHNLFMQIAIDLGIFGFGVFISFIFVAIKNLLAANLSKDKFIKIISGALCASLAGYLLQGLTDNVWYNYRIVCFFWLLAAISGTLYELKGDEVIVQKN